MPSSFTRLWWMEVLRGLLGIAFALLLVLLQVHLLKVVVILIGFYFVADGAGDGYTLATGRRTSRRFWWDLTLVVFSIGIGFACIFEPIRSVLLLVDLIAVRLVLRGIAEARMAWRSRGSMAGVSWLYGAGLIAAGVLLAVFTPFWIRLFVLLIIVYSFVDGAFLLTRGLVLRYAPARYQARVLPPGATTPDLPPDAPPTLRRALVFVRRAGASGLRHIGWAFEWHNGWFNTGSVENRAGKPFAKPEEMDFWSTHTQQPIRTAQQQLTPYDEFKVFNIEEPQPKAAWKTVIWESRVPYVLVRHNCNDVTYDVLRAYGVTALYDPAEEYVPNDWYDALPGPSYSMRQHPAVPIHLHRASTRPLPTTEIPLNIPPHIQGTEPPWRQGSRRAWEEIRLITLKMFVDVRTLARMRHKGVQPTSSSSS